MLNQLLAPFFSRGLRLVELLVVSAIHPAAFGEHGATWQADTEEKNQAEKSHRRLVYATFAFAASDDQTNCRDLSNSSITW